MTGAEEIGRCALPLGTSDDLDPLLERVGGARYVLIGEASHGTRDFYLWRAALTRRLIAEKGFRFVGVEGDWPDCERIHRAVTGDGSTDEAVNAFTRWPTFMWANEEVAEFCRWLRAWNDALPPERRAGFHGLDVYSLRDSLLAVHRYAQRHLPGQTDKVLRALHCFEAYGHDPQLYGLATRMLPASCEDEVVGMLSAVRREVPADEEGFDALQNAEVVAGAERYYRAMVRGGPESWNRRDIHMADTLDRLTDFYGGAKGIVWAHNTHVGDARATDMAAAGMTNLGQLARERHGPDAVVLVGFGTHRGTVIAGREWGAPSEVMPVPPARPGSLEDRMHAAGLDRALFVVPPPDARRPAWYERPLEHRAIGVVYRPEHDRTRNYVPTVLGRRYDAFLWLDETAALHPLHGEPPDETEPETFPSAL